MYMYIHWQVELWACKTLDINLRQIYGCNTRAPVAINMTVAYSSVPLLRG